MLSVHHKEVPRLAVRPSRPQEELRRQQTHHLLESHSRTAQALWMEPQAQWMPSVHRKEVPKPPVRPSSPQEESHRQQTHHLFEPRSRATQVLPQQLQAQQRHSAHHKVVRREWTPCLHHRCHLHHRPTTLLRCLQAVRWLHQR